MMDHIDLKTFFIQMAVVYVENKGSSRESLPKVASIDDIKVYIIVNRLTSYITCIYGLSIFRFFNK